MKKNKILLNCILNSNSLLRFESLFIQVLDDMVSEYSKSSHGPGKWQKLATFTQQWSSSVLEFTVLEFTVFLFHDTDFMLQFFIFCSVDGPILDLFKKRWSQLESENSALKLQCRSNDDKLEFLKKQSDANEKHKNEYMKRYEEAVNDRRKISDDYSIHITNLQTKSKTLDDKCINLSKALEAAKCESSDWKLKYEHSISELKGEEDKFKAEFVILKSRASAAEGRLDAAREQSESANQEALEWKRKYDTAVGEAKAALERAALSQERTNKMALEREDLIREEFFNQLSEKVSILI